MLSAQIDSWGREVEENRKSWRPVLSSSSSSMWSWLRSAVPLLLIATFALAAIFFIDVDLLRDESIDRNRFVETTCDVMNKELVSLECSRQSGCEIQNRCHKQIYYTCYYPVWHVRYKLNASDEAYYDATIHHEHTVFSNTQDAESVLNSIPSSETCYADVRNPSRCQWIRPNPTPFFVFMIFTASLLGILCCCLAMDRLCNLDSPRQFVIVPSVLSSSTDDPFQSLDDGKDMPMKKKKGGNNYGSLSTISRAFV